MGRRHSPSSAPLAERCLYSFRPDVEVAPFEGNAATRVGLLVHKSGERDALFWPEDVKEVGASGEEVEEAAALSEMWLSSPERARYRDWEREVELEGPLRGSVSRFPKCDLLKIEDGIVYVADFKTGRHGSIGWYRHQLETYAWLASRLHPEVDSAVIQVVHITEEGVEVDGTELDLFDLMAVGERIERQIAEIPTAEPNPGPWCHDRYCGAISVCPAHTRALQQVSEPDFRLPVLTQDNAASVLEMWERGRAIVEALEPMLQEFADKAGGIETEHGVWGARPRTMEFISLSGAEGAEVEAYLQQQGVSIKTTKKATKTDVNKLGKKKADEVMKHLRAIGGTRTTTSKTYKRKKA